MKIFYAEQNLPESSSCLFLLFLKLMSLLVVSGICCFSPVFFVSCALVRIAFFLFALFFYLLWSFGGFYFGGLRFAFCACCIFALFFNNKKNSATCINTIFLCLAFCCALFFCFAFICSYSSYLTFFLLGLFFL